MGPSGLGRIHGGVEIIAEGLIALTQSLALGYIDGRFTDLEQLVAVLVRFALGVLPPR